MQSGSADHSSAHALSPRPQHFNIRARISRASRQVTYFYSCLPSVAQTPCSVSQVPSKLPPTFACPPCPLWRGAARCAGCHQSCNNISFESYTYSHHIHHQFTGLSHHLHRFLSPQSHAHRLQQHDASQRWVGHRGQSGHHQLCSLHPHFDSRVRRHECGL